MLKSFCQDLLLGMIKIAGNGRRAVIKMVMAALILKDKKKEPLKLIDIRMNTLLDPFLKVCASCTSATTLNVLTHLIYPSEHICKICATEIAKEEVRLVKTIPTLS